MNSTQPRNETDFGKFLNREVFAEINIFWVKETIKFS